MSGTYKFHGLGKRPMNHIPDELRRKWRNAAAAERAEWEAIQEELREGEKSQTLLKIAEERLQSIQSLAERFRNSEGPAYTLAAEILDILE